jgi:Cdc6-like AAA superfamily ATPase
MPTTSIENPFSLETSRLSCEDIMDRAEELNMLAASLVSRRENVLVIGEYGIGKTCLLKKFRSQIAESYQDSVLLVEIDMLWLSGSIASFLETVLRKVIMQAWRQIFNRNYSELLMGLDGETKLEEHVFRQMHGFIKLFQLMRPEGATYTKTKENEIGAKTPFTATHAEKFSMTVDRGELSPSEFILLSEEVFDVLSKRGYSQIIVFGDEANHINKELEIDLFKRHFEVFSENNVQFVFTAREETLSTIPKLREAFPITLKLQGFDSPKVIKDMLSVYSKKLTSAAVLDKVSDAAIDQLWRVTKGHPREIQRICQRCVEKVLQSKAYTIESQQILDACIELYEFTPR